METTVETTEKPLTGIQEKRQRLKEMSKAVSPFVVLGEYETVNEGIIDMFYRPSGHIELHTFRQWREKGFTVKKEEKALLLWAKPLSALKEERKEEPEEDEKIDFFPVCFVFSQLQVKPLQR